MHWKDSSNFYVQANNAEIMYFHSIAKEEKRALESIVSDFINSGCEYISMFEFSMHAHYPNPYEKTTQVFYGHKNIGYVTVLSGMGSVIMHVGSFYRQEKDVTGTGGKESEDCLHIEKVQQKLIGVDKSGE
jgi:hypothetical protein